MAQKKVVLKIFRGDTDRGEEVTYQAPVFPGMVVLDAGDGTTSKESFIFTSLACRWNCKAAKCGSCSAESKRVSAPYVQNTESTVTAGVIVAFVRCELFLL